MSSSMVETIIKRGREYNPRLANPWPCSIRIPDLNMIEQGPFGGSRLVYAEFGPWFRDVLGYSPKVTIETIGDDAAILAYFHNPVDIELFRLAFDHWWQGVRR